MKGLFKYYVKVVELVRPRYFVMENVPNLLTAENGYFQKEIIDLFNGMGYDLNMGILNAADYGVPQNRRRAVIIGKRDGKAPALPKKAEQRVTIWDAISDLAFLESGEGQEKQEYVNTPTSDYEKSLRGDAQVLYNHVATKHSKLALERLVIRSISPAFAFLYHFKKMFAVQDRGAGDALVNKYACKFLFGVFMNHFSVVLHL